MSEAQRGEVGYMQAHLRVKNSKGRAANYQCVDCGKPGQHWSYDGEDENECIEYDLLYSLDIEHYVPRCVKCHARHDHNADAGLQPAVPPRAAGWYVCIRWSGRRYLYRPFFKTLEKARVCRDRYLELHETPTRDILVEIAKEVRRGH